MGSQVLPYDRRPGSPGARGVWTHPLCCSSGGVAGQCVVVVPVWLAGVVGTAGTIPLCGRGQPKFSRGCPLASAHHFQGWVMASHPPLTKQGAERRFILQMPGWDPTRSGVGSRAAVARQDDALCRPQVAPPCAPPRGPPLPPARHVIPAQSGGRPLTLHRGSVLFIWGRRWRQASSTPGRAQRSAG